MPMLCIHTYVYKNVHTAGWRPGITSRRSVFSIYIYIYIYVYIYISITYICIFYVYIHSFTNIYIQLGGGQYSGTQII